MVGMAQGDARRDIKMSKCHRKDDVWLIVLIFLLIDGCGCAALPRGVPMIDLADIRKLPVVRVMPPPHLPLLVLPPDNPHVTPAEIRVTVITRGRYYACPTQNNSSLLP